jgi:drug/metabolite transporter (DMT)-like permease
VGPTILLALAGALGFGVADLWNLRISRGMGSAASLVWKFSIEAAVALPVVLVLGELPPYGGWGSLAPAAAAGVFGMIGLACLLNGLRTGDLSIVGPLTALDGGVAAFVAIVAGERLPPIAYVGLALAVVGGSLAAAEKGRRTAAGVGWALLSAASFAVAFLLFAETGDIAAVTTAFVAAVVGIALALPVAMLAGPMRVPERLGRFVAGAAILELAATAAAAASLSRGPVSIASVLLAQFATVVAILGVTVLHERPAPHQLAGVVLAIVATCVLALTT